LTVRAVQAFRIASQVERSAVWKSTSPPGAALASIEAHLPKSAKLGSHGEQIGAEADATFAFPTVDRRSLRARALVLVTLGQPGGGSIVWVEAEVRYTAPRPYDQQIPEQARVLELTVGSNLPRPLLSRKVTNLSEVRRIAQIVDDLPFDGNESGAVFSCPLDSATFPVDRFIFRATPGGTVLAKVTESADTPTSDDPCAATSLTVRGRKEPTLQDGGILLRQAGALLNARLSCTTKFVTTGGGVGHRFKPEVQCEVR
jgi:hypothetical protein